MDKNIAVVLAGGQGKRFSSAEPKQFLKLEDKIVLEYSLLAFERNKYISGIIIVVNKDYNTLVREIIERNNIKKV